MPRAAAAARGWAAGCSSLLAHGLVFAEGVLAETFVDDDSRGLFHNGAEYRALYADAVRQPARYYAARVEQGFILEAVRRRLNGIAGGECRRAARV